MDVGLLLLACGQLHLIITMDVVWLGASSSGSRKRKWRRAACWKLLHCGSSVDGAALYAGSPSDVVAEVELAPSYLPAASPPSSWKRTWKETPPASYSACVRRCRVMPMELQSSLQDGCRPRALVQMEEGTAGRSSCVVVVRPGCHGRQRVISTWCPWPPLARVCVAAASGLCGLMCTVEEYMEEDAASGLSGRRRRGTSMELMRPPSISSPSSPPWAHLNSGPFWCNLMCYQK